MSIGISGSSEEVLRSSETEGKADSSSKLGDLEEGLNESSRSLLSCSEVVERSEIRESVRERAKAPLELPELSRGNGFQVELISILGPGWEPLLLSSSSESSRRLSLIIAISRWSTIGCTTPIPNGLAIEQELESGSSRSGV
ncbi:GSCOCG00007505001-RA-CDS [Cotesia congregata]|nr:GSCOCG00007505001-RA-CDS [Cotesia congregata]